MSNTNAPNGFQYFGRQEGGSPTVGYTIRKVKLDNATAIGFGDPVSQLNTGYVTLSVAGTLSIFGIFAGCEYLNTAIGNVRWSPNWPGGTQGSDATAYIISDPDALFVVQSNNTAITFGDIGLNINPAIGTPATTAAGGVSTSTVAQSTLATTNTLAFRVVGLLSQYIPANSVNGTDDTSAYNRVIVAPNFWDRKSLEGL
jgi:hypothetical protein